MSKTIDNLMDAMKVAAARRPRAGGFPYLAEVLRKAGVTRNVWSLPPSETAAYHRSFYSTVLFCHQQKITAPEGFTLRRCSLKPNP